MPRSLNVRSTSIFFLLLSFWCTTVNGQPSGRTIGSSIPPPIGFSRTPVENGSFGSYLRSLPLRPAGTLVHLFNGELKARQDVHAAVIDISTGERDLQQCADAVMRLRAEYLFANGREDGIAFDFTNGFRAEWKRWRRGERIQVNGNRCTWAASARPDASHAQLLHFLETVFTYAGTRSLQSELDRSATARPASDVLYIGDVFIHGGSPGHAMIVVDMAKQRDGRTAFLLAQSYMPAQDIHVVKNLRHPELGAWFVMDQDDQLFTPEWTFDWSDHRSW